MSIEGVGQAVAHAEDSVAACLRTRAVRTGAGRLAALAATRGATMSAELDDSKPAERLLAGALRVNAEVPRLAGIWERAPLQVIARTHVLAAADVASQSALGRPRDPQAADVLGELATMSLQSAGPAVVEAALVHGRLLAESPMVPATGVVARGLERVVLVSRGLDTLGVLAPELGHGADRGAYDRALEGLRSGSSSGLAGWVEHCCLAYATAADRALAALDEDPARG